MAEAAAPVIAESLLAESFAVAAPTMFTGAELAPLALETTAGAGLGTAGLLSNYSFGEGAGLLSDYAFGDGAAGLLGEGLLGEYATGEGILGALAGEAPITQTSMVADALTGGAGAGAEGINAAQVLANQAKATGIPEGLSNAALNSANPEYLRMAADADAMARNASLVEQTAGQGMRETMMTGRAAGSELSAGEGIKAGINNTGLKAPTLTPDQLAGPSNTSFSQGLNFSSPMNTGPVAPAPSGLEAGFNKALQYVKDSPFSAGSMALNAAQFLGKKEKEGPAAPEKYDGPLSKYKMSPEFQGRQANPEDYQYTPQVYGMAEGGIASYKKGGIGQESMDYYERMTRPMAAPSQGDVGIYYDQDPDTRYQDALTAAQIRMAKVNKRANMQSPNMKRPTQLGQINLTPPGIKAAEARSSLDPETAAQGGIMRASLGGYAAGGNPRLLRGPGDGMSDNIPATIAGKQPARLADGEFVIPADVVSHLGNGSTEAGAKVLHAMMTKVRKERTGNPKQGKQIKPNKFMPK